jgi:CRISPR system Cascade subunit CasB
MSETRSQYGRDGKFAAYLVTLRDGTAWDRPSGKPFNGRAAMAALRAGLRGRPGEQVEMFRYLGPYLPDHPGRVGDARFTVAALFGSWSDMPWTPRDRDQRTDFGASLRSLRVADGGDSIERRFVALLNADFDSVPIHLRNLIALCKGGSIAVDWGTLSSDLARWDSSGRPVQGRWATSFWRYTANPDGDPDSANPTTTKEPTDADESSATDTGGEIQ